MSVSEVVFSHGQESGPWGMKITALARVARARGFSASSLDYQGMTTVEERCARLRAHIATLDGPPLLAGSSMGAYVSLQVARVAPVAGLFLLAPPLWLPGYDDIPERLPDIPLVVVHGWQDDVCPWQGSLRLCEQLGGELLLLPGDHRLTTALPRIGQLFAGVLESFGSA